MTPLFDINVVLDVLLVRPPWFADSAQVWDAHRNDTEKRDRDAGKLKTKIRSVADRQAREHHAESDHRCMDVTGRSGITTGASSSARRSSIPISRFPHARSLETEASSTSEPPPFITLSRHGGVTRVTFTVEMQFDLESGRPDDWQRLKIADLE